MYRNSCWREKTKAAEQLHRKLRLSQHWGCLCVRVRGLWQLFGFLWQETTIYLFVAIFISYYSITYLIIKPYLTKVFLNVKGNHWHFDTNGCHFKILSHKKVQRKESIFKKFILTMYFFPNACKNIYLFILNISAILKKLPQLK